MVEDKVREVFADMVVLKDPQRSEYFSNLSIPSYMRDWLVMKFSDDEGVIDYDSVRRYIKRYIPSREDFEQYKFQMVNQVRLYLNCLISAEREVAHRV